MWLIIKGIIETLYYLSGIGLLFGVIAAAKQLKLFKKDLHDRNTRLAVETSLKYLDLFATKFIPECDAFIKSLREEVPKPVELNILLDGKFNLKPEDVSKDALVETIIKHKLGAHHLLNQLEYFSVGIINKLADEDIVYTPIAIYFCDFVNSHYLFISYMRSQGAPFTNVVNLYRKWTDRIEAEKDELLKQEAEHRIKQKGNSYKSSPPIGL